MKEQNKDKAIITEYLILKASYDGWSTPCDITMSHWDDNSTIRIATICEDGLILIPEKIDIFVEKLLELRDTLKQVKGKK